MLQENVCDHCRERVMVKGLPGSLEVDDAHELATGAILMAVAISGGPAFVRHLYRIGLRG